MRHILRPTRERIKLAYLLWLLGIESATGVAAMAEIKGDYGYIEDFDFGDDSSDDEDSTMFLAAGHAASASDARDMRACGCEWGDHEVEYIYSHDRKAWIRGCSVPLVNLLKGLGVVRCEICIESDEIVHECGAW